MSSGIRMCVAAVAALLCAAAQAEAPSRPLVIELFTAQGCSSCPPADALLGKLSTRPDILALAFHVDYWDSLGWHDRFALHQGTERQNAYAHNFHRASVYTPQFVIDGRTDSVDSAGLEQALREPRDGVPVSLAVRDAQVVVELGERPGVPASEVMLVAFLRHAVSSVGRGENAGRTLEEFNIVRAMRTLGSWKGTPQSFQVKVSSLPADATDVAVLVQPRGQAPIVGAATQSLR